MIEYIYFLSNDGFSEVFYWCAKISFAIVNFVYQGHFIMIERQQFSRSEISDYLQFWNLVNILQISLNLATLISSFFVYEETNGLYTIAAISMFMSCLNMFYIIRVYDNLAWFIILLQKTVKDLDSIIIVFVLCLLTFGCTSLVLQKSRSDASDALVVDAIGVPVIDAMITSYLVGLGDFSTDFSGNN